MKTFRTLDQATDFFETVQALKLTGHLRDQLLRGASSIALNLAEGNAKFSVNEKRRFYQIAYASTKECQTILKLVKAEESVVKEADYLGACVFKLMNSKLKKLKPASVY